MNSEDKTGDKLVASMRKSKTGTVASRTTERPGARQASARPKASTSKPAMKAAATDRDVNNPFSHGRRVWPD
jgi:hypothetical protein